MFFRLTSDPRSSRIEEDAYSVYIDSSKVHMELEKKRYINVKKSGMETLTKFFKYLKKTLIR